MIIHTPQSNIQLSDEMRTKTFAIKASAKGFRIISQNLYKDPIKAIVRELACNAWDGHQMNGNVNKPIDIHLPTDLEPWFSIRDYGIGMADEDIFGVYTTVFDSTKDNSNAVIGAMGLGSKTPFAYNGGQAFIVTSIHKGIKGVYSAYLNNGIPDITCMVEPHATTEPDGVEVKVPVVRTDFDKFKKAAEATLHSFKLPSVSTNLNLSSCALDYSYECSDYCIVSNNPYWLQSYGTVVARMGHIIYPISGSNIDSNLWRTINTLTKSSGSIRSAVKVSPIIIDFKIGEVDISASREEVHYDDYTINNINTKIKIVIDKFVKDQQELINKSNFKTIREAYLKIAGQSPVGDLLTYNGKDFKTWVNSFNAIRDISIRNKAKMVQPTQGAKEPAKIHSCNSYGTTLAGHIVNPMAEYHTKPLLVIKDDLKTGGVGISKIYSAHVNKTAVYINDAQPKTLELFDLISKYLEPSEYTVVTTSDLKKQGFKPTAKTRKKIETVQVFTLVNGKLSNADVDLNELKNGKYMYVGYYRDMIVDSNQCKAYGLMDSAPSFVSTIATNIDPKMKVYAIRSKYIQHAKANPNAVDLTDKKIIEKNFDKFDVEALAFRQLVEYTQSNRLSFDNIISQPELCELIGIDVSMKSKYEWGFIQQIRQAVGDSHFKKVFDRSKELVKLIEDFANKYPIIELSGYFNRHKRYTDCLVHLIKTAETKRGK